MAITQKLNSKANVKKFTNQDIPFAPQKPVLAYYQAISTASQTIINLSFSIDTVNNLNSMIITVDGKALTIGATNDYTFTSIDSFGFSSQITLNQTLVAGLNIQAWKLGFKDEGLVTPITVNTVEFTSSGNWTCPQNVYQVEILACGGGGGGGGGTDVGGYQHIGGSQGGAGSRAWTTKLDVIPGTVYPIVIGAGGSGGTAAGPSGNGSNGGNGGDTTFDSIVVGKGAPGGNTGEGQLENNGGGVYNLDATINLPGVHNYLPNRKNQFGRESSYGGNSLGFATTSTPGHNGESTTEFAGGLGGNWSGVTGGGGGGGASNFGAGGHGRDGSGGPNAGTAGQGYGAGGGGGQGGWGGGAAGGWPGANGYLKLYYVG
jgi:hypothetical protein